jgi:hypothetical protein
MENAGAIRESKHEVTWNVAANKTGYTRTYFSGEFGTRDYYSYKRNDSIHAQAFIAIGSNILNIYSDKFKK